MRRAARSAYTHWGAIDKATEMARHSGMPALVHHPGNDTTTITPTAETTSQLDIATVLKASNAISSELVLERLMRRLLDTAIESAGAHTGCFLMERDGQLLVEAESTIEPRPARLLQSAPMSSARVCSAIAQFVARTRTHIVLSDASTDGQFKTDDYVVTHQTRSVLCVPIVRQEQLLGVLYLENDLVAGAFTSDRLLLLQQLASQIAVSIENAQLYAGLDEARRKAVSAGKAKTRFLMTMSHEFRTPLTSIVGYADMIDEDIVDEVVHDIPQFTQTIRGAAAALLSTLTGVLEFAKLEDGETEVTIGDVDLRASLDEILASLSQEALRNQNEVHLHIPPIRTIRTDRAKLHYCLSALLDNACRFTEQGRVQVEVEQDAHGSAPFTEIRFVDNGPGIAETLHQSIFDPFRQADDSRTRGRDGAGISLAVTKRFADILGGSVTLESELGVGSTFHLRIPFMVGAQSGE